MVHFRYRCSTFITMNGRCIIGREAVHFVKREEGTFPGVIKPVFGRKVRG